MNKLILNFGKTYFVCFVQLNSSYDTYLEGCIAVVTHNKDQTSLLINNTSQNTNDLFNSFRPPSRKRQTIAGGHAVLCSEEV